MLRLILALGLLVVALPAAAERRVALVVGNAAYAETPLRNPVNDARAMADMLRRAGFDVLLRQNLGKTAFERAIAEFGDKLAAGGGNSVGLFFYAGHGMQLRGRNYLIPVDATIASEQRVRIETVDVDLVLEQMQAARARVSFAILDACRNNPFERRFRSAAGGLAQMDAPEGTLVAYATAPGRVAADGEGANGLYTAELLRAMARPGLRIEDVFKQARAGVSRVSGGAQVPWESSSLTGDFHLFGAGAASAAPAAPSDVDAWLAVRDADAIADLEAFASAHPASPFVELARVRIRELSSVRPEPAVAADAPPVVDGRYEATVPAAATRGGYGDVWLEIDVRRGRVTGHGGSATKPGAVCRASGHVGLDGRINGLELVCDGATIVAVREGEFGRREASRQVAGAQRIGWGRVTGADGSLHEFDWRTGR